MTTIALHNIDTLKLLQRTCCEGSASFFHAARVVVKAELAELFETLGEQRKLYERELRHFAENHGGQLEDAQAVFAQSVEAWTQVMAALTPGDDHAVLNACARVETDALRHYRLALEKITDLSTRGLIRAQIGGVEWGHSVVSDLCHSIIYRSARSA